MANGKGTKRALEGTCLWLSELVNFLLFIMLSKFRVQRNQFMELVKLYVSRAALHSPPSPSSRSLMCLVSFKEKKSLGGD